MFIRLLSANLFFLSLHCYVIERCVVAAPGVNAVVAFRGFCCSPKQSGAKRSEADGSAGWTGGVFKGGLLSPLMFFKSALISDSFGCTVFRVVQFFNSLCSFNYHFVNVNSPLIHPERSERNTEQRQSETVSVHLLLLVQMIVSFFICSAVESSQQLLLEDDEETN